MNPPSPWRLDEDGTYFIEGALPLRVNTDMQGDVWPIFLHQPDRYTVRLEDMDEALGHLKTLTTWLMEQRKST